MPAQPVFEPERTAAFESSTISSNYPVDIFRVNSLRPTLTDFRFMGAPCKIDPGTIEVMA